MPNMAERVRPVTLAPADIAVRRSGETVYMQSRRALGPYPVRITERLEHWAERAPDRVFLAQRDATGAWCRVTYGERLKGGKLRDVKWDKLMGSIRSGK